MAGDEVRGDYEKLEQVSRQFGEKSQSTEEMLNKVRQAMESLRGGFQGLAADAFFQEMESELLPASDRLKNVLNEASNVTKQISETLSQAEQEAAGLFR